MATNDDTRCPHCGMRVDIIELIEPTDRQKAIRAAIEEIATEKRQTANGRSRGQVFTAKTGEIVERLNLWAELGEIDADMPRSRATVKNDLAHLRAMGALYCPNGAKSGWAKRTARTFALVRAA